METDPIQRALILRRTLKEGDKILVVDFSDTLQGKDTSRVIDLMPNVKTGEYLFRAKVNVKDIDPIAAPEYGKQFVDVSTMSDSEIEDFVKRQEFDFPLWFKHVPGFNIRNILDYNPPFVLQVAGCNFHDGKKSGGCWYCFVDDKSNNGQPGKGKTQLTIDDTIDSFIGAREKVSTFYKENNTDLKLRVLRASGGEPTIVLDWVLELWRRISKRGLDIVGQIDTNLSTGQVIETFEQAKIYEKHILEKLAEHPVKVLAALKGVDNRNLQESVQAKTTVEEQKYSLKKLIKAGLDVFIQLYNPNPESLENYLMQMDREVQNFSLKVHIGPLKVYRPTIERLSAEAALRALDAKALIESAKSQWDDNYRRSCEVIDYYLRQAHGVGYKDTVRADVELKVVS